MDSYAFTPNVEMNELCDRYGASVFRRCLQILGNPTEAEDAAQEIFMTILTKGSSFRHESQPSTWIYRVTTNHCLNILRAKKRRQKREQSDAVKGWMGRSQQGPQEIVETQHTVARFLDSLDELSQQLFIYRFVDGLTQTEIEKVTGKSRRTIGKKLKKINLLLQSHLEHGVSE